MGEYDRWGNWKPRNSGYPITNNQPIRSNSQRYPSRFTQTFPPARTSITQPPVLGTKRSKPILYSSPGCEACKEMMKEFRKRHPGKNIVDYFDVIDDPDQFQPSIAGGAVGMPYILGAIDAVVAAGPVRNEPVPKGPQPVEFKMEYRVDANGRQYAYYYLEGALDKGFLEANYVLKDPATGEEYSLPEIAKLVASSTLVFSAVYDSKGEFASIYYKFQNPDDNDDSPRIVPDPSRTKTQSPTTSQKNKPRYSRYYVDSPKPKDPTTMTNEELKKATKEQNKNNQEARERLQKAEEAINAILEENKPKP